jgi:hypothetical protein
MKRKIDLMHELFEEDYGMNKCEICDHLKKFNVGSRSVYKCECYGITSSEATDWGPRWFACGLLNEEYNGIPVMKLKHNGKKLDEPIEGQVSLFE